MKKLGILFTTVIMIMLVALSASANDNVYKVGDIIQFGTYPQTEVKDEALIAELNALAPEWDEWISYGYYSGNGEMGSMVQGDWMRYIDIYFQNERYRGVKFISYRPYYTYCDFPITTSQTYQDNNGYLANIIYWFKFEPINWHVIDSTEGTVLCDLIIDSQPYSNNIYRDNDLPHDGFNDPNFLNYANDYDTSSIKIWLNDMFYDTAFSNSEVKEISGEVFLLTEYSVSYELRQYSHILSVRAKPSDYAKCQGLEVVKSYSEECSNWIIREPFSKLESSYCACINFNGNVGYQFVETSQGVRPALNLKNVAHKHEFVLQTEKQATHFEEGRREYMCFCGCGLAESIPIIMHTYDPTVTRQSTCLEKGIIIYTCTCGDSYTESIPATNHPNATTDAGKAPTTTEVGYTAGKYCPDCKTWIEGHTEIPKLEEHKHSYTPTTTQEATCWREGVKTYTCSCGDTYTEAIAKLEHQYRPWETKNNPTCTAAGLEWSYCLICDNDFEREIPATGHTVIDYTRRATPDSDGAYVTACDVCNEEFKSISFGRPSEYKLSTTTYTYNGKAKTPKLTVTTSDGKVLKKGVDYTVELPKDRTSVGTHTYRVVFMGDYLGETKVSYQILPGKTSSVSASQSTDYIKLSWKKVSGATGYRVYQYNSSTGKYKTLKTLTGTSYTVKNLKAGTTYKFAVKAYTKADGETLWAASSKTLTTATKPATPTVKATAGSGKATLSWNKVTGATGYVIYMEDSFGDFEKVTSTTKTSYTKKSLKKGKTYKFRVKAYKKIDGKYIYSGYKTYSVKVK